MIPAAALLESGNEGLGMRWPVRWSSVSVRPVDLNSPAASAPYEVAVAGSGSESVTVHPAFERMKLAIGAWPPPFSASASFGSGERAATSLRIGAGAGVEVDVDVDVAWATKAGLAAGPLAGASESTMSPITWS